MASGYTVQTPENVAVSYQLAGIGSRFMAAAADSIISFVLIILVLLAIGVAGGLALSSRRSARPHRRGAGTALASGWSRSSWWPSSSLLWGYYAAFEMAWNGQTPGKRLTRLRVLRESGYPIGPIDALILTSCGWSTSCRWRTGSGWWSCWSTSGRAGWATSPRARSS